ncbi:MAG: NAD-dependent epimerase/dehydratase family protein [Planctomycetota bacterium]|nr:MAG: NAD-dependent epimerase/dehydratase family protein [Planctomycetota bacterium]REJ93616.1 MAG: NAD-dependent epimerase/dehydratase family protein [Planctomycetota bacterium]REK20043.1 MAG: NAD-dependent epimerase/dehydratase family protein [Planctomycetota bacterium]REK27520.1 MAG: NAD-dependent epimerase/dehydratase family protein [Planctomycetota bacterium]
MKTLLVTGSSGLVGSEAVEYFDRLGWRVHGVDNNLRREFFGPDGDTNWNLARLREATTQFQHHDLDIRDRAAVSRIFREIEFDFVIHAAAQPSHDLAARRPFDDFDVNAVGTMNLLEATRSHRPEAVFCFLSTNKVYGDSPNELPLVELETRWDYANPEHRDGIDETCRIDRTLHSLFGASKVAADIMVQEYGRYFGMKTACFRGGCLTGSQHSAVELHGFLAYVMRATAEGRTYRVYGYQGKQVRDNIHAFDVCRALHAFYENPRPGEVYNIGGGRANSVSVLEAIDRAEQALGRRLKRTYEPQNRVGDHICYISNLGKLQSHFPGWSITRSLDDIYNEMAEALQAGKRPSAGAGE